jgi:hypothetical protein
MNEETWGRGQAESENGNICKINEGQKGHFNFYFSSSYSPLFDCECQQ